MNSIIVEFRGITNFFEFHKETGFLGFTDSRENLAILEIHRIRFKCEEMLDFGYRPNR
jgi:hypothetical protein